MYKPELTSKLWKQIEDITEVFKIRQSTMPGSRNHEPASGREARYGRSEAEKLTERSTQRVLVLIRAHRHF
jgi:hypothetical protein